MAEVQTIRVAHRSWHPTGGQQVCIQIPGHSPILNRPALAGASSSTLCIGFQKSFRGLDGTVEDCFLDTIMYLHFTLQSRSPPAVIGCSPQNLR